MDPPREPLPAAALLPVIEPPDDRALRLLLALLNDPAAMRRALGPPVWIRRQGLARVALAGTVRRDPMESCGIRRSPGGDPLRLPVR